MMQWFATGTHHMRRRIHVKSYEEEDTGCNGLQLVRTCLFSAQQYTQ